MNLSWPISAFTLLSRFFPSTCLSCGTLESGLAQGVLCAKCDAQIKFATGNICSVCGAPLEFDYEVDTGESYKCSECIAWPPRYEAFRFAMIYSGSVRELFHAFKFKGERRLATPLAAFGEGYLGSWMSQWPDAVIIPAPLAKQKLYTRGYNPAYLLAKILGEKAGLKVAEGALRRIRSTAPQFGLSARERIENVKGAFAVHSPNVIRGKRVIFFDDIHTTGATVRECCKTIARAKPKALRVATLCRAGK